MTRPVAEAATLLHVFPSFRVGGAQMRFASVANRFGPRYRHLVVSLDGADNARERLAPALDLIFPSLSAGSSAKLTAIRRALRALRPDVLITHNWGSMDWAIANLPGLARHIHIEDGFGPEERDHQFRRRILTRRLVLRRSTLVLPSRTLLGIATDIWRLPSRRLRYIPNGIELDRFATSAAACFPGTGPVIGTVAALRPEKALDRLLRAFSAMAPPTPARLVIAGDGPERPRLERLAAELGVAARVHFTGHVGDPAPLYAGFDIFALSSDTEQMPLSVIEAMAAGLAVAATDVGDVRHMLAADNDPFVGPRDAGALAASLTSLIANPPLRARLGAANRAKARHAYDQEAMFAAYAVLFDGDERAPVVQARRE